MHYYLYITLIYFHLFSLFVEVECVRVEWRAVRREIWRAIWYVRAPAMRGMRERLRYGYASRTRALRAPRHCASSAVASRTRHAYTRRYSRRRRAARRHASARIRAPSHAIRATRRLINYARRYGHGAMFRFCFVMSPNARATAHYVMRCARIYTMLRRCCFYQYARARAFVRHPQHTQHCLRRHVVTMPRLLQRGALPQARADAIRRRYVVARVREKRHYMLRRARRLFERRWCDTHMSARA